MTTGNANKMNTARNNALNKLAFTMNTEPKEHNPDGEGPPDTSLPGFTIKALAVENTDLRAALAECVAALKAGLEAANECRLNATYHKRVMNEALTRATRYFRSTAMSDTPLTDAEMFDMNFADGPDYENINYVVPVSFARTLETTAAELRARVAELERERDELRGKLNLECSNHDSTVDRCAAALTEIDILRTDKAELTAQLAAAKADWQPIATAPKDGTEIVCWLGGPSCLSYDAESKLRVLRWSDHYSVFGLGGCWTDGLSTLGDGIDVTLWMPLPPTAARAQRNDH